MRRLIVNADDFGWSRGVNRGIIECFQKGIVNSTSILATGSAFDDAVNLAKQNPNLQIGIHLNFYRGQALLKESGALPASVAKFILGMLTGRIKISQIEKEFRAQIERVLAVGLKPVHLDSEKHLHHWPSIFAITIKLAREYGLPYVRLVRERPSVHLIALVLTILSYYNISSTQVLKSGLKFTDSTIGVTHYPVNIEGLERALESGKGKRIEFVVHPGFIDEEFNELQKIYPNKFTYSREAELEVLTSPEAKALLHNYGYTLDRNPA